LLHPLKGWSLQDSRGGSEGDDVVVSERPQGTFSRQLFLGETLDTGSIEASSHNGVLTLTIPVAEQAKARKITIATGDKAIIEGRAADTPSNS
jgi:HSP20 family protein